LEAALAQVERVARARNLSTDEITPLIAKHTEGRFFGDFWNRVSPLKLITIWMFPSLPVNDRSEKVNSAAAVRP